MRLTLSALVVAAGLAGFGVAAQAAPVSGMAAPGVATSDVQHVQMHRMERRMMRHRMERRMMRRRMERRSMRRRMM